MVLRSAYTCGCAYLRPDIDLFCAADRRCRRVADEGFVEMTLIGETGLIGKYRQISSPARNRCRAQSNAGHIGKADRSQACIPLKSANQSSYGKANLRQCVQRRRVPEVAADQAGNQLAADAYGGSASALCMWQGAQQVIISAGSPRFVAE